MTCYIVTIELVFESDQDIISEAIKSYGTWARITEHTWALVSRKKSKDIRNHLSSSVNHQCRLFVIKSGREAAWNGVMCDHEWLKKKL